MDTEILNRLRSELDVETLMREEDRARRGLEHLRAARAALSELETGSDLTDLDELIDEVAEAVEYLAKARRG